MVGGNYLLLSIFLFTACSAKSWHPLQKRQEDLNPNDCEEELPANAICNNGHNQIMAFVAAQCNQTEDAIMISNFCRRNARGDFCGSFNGRELERFSSACNQSIMELVCMEECRGFLTSIRSRYGCCLNFFNSSGFLADGSHEMLAFSHLLWSHCGVEPVDEECAPSTFELPEVDPTCGPEDINDRLHSNVFCNRKLLYATAEAALSRGCTNVEVTEENERMVFTQCAVDEEGRYCQFRPAESLWNQEPALRASCTNTDMCDPLCIATLTNVTNAYGCCFVSELNGTTVDQARDYLSYEFWQRCGLTSPGFCDVMFGDSGTVMPVAAAKYYYYAIAIYLAAFLMLNNG